MNDCPDRNLLERLLNDRLADTELDGVEHHVQVCASCQQTLQELSDDGIWRSELRNEISLLLDDAETERVVDPLGMTAGATVDGTLGGTAGALDGEGRNVPAVPGYEITGELGAGAWAWFTRRATSD